MQNIKKIELLPFTLILRSLSLSCNYEEKYNICQGKVIERDINTINYSKCEYRETWVYSKERKCNYRTCGKCRHKILHCTISSCCKLVERVIGIYYY